MRLRRSPPQMGGQAITQHRVHFIYTNSLLDLALMLRALLRFLALGIDFFRWIQVYPYQRVVPCP